MQQAQHVRFRAHYFSITITGPVIMQIQHTLVRGSVLAFALVVAAGQARAQQRTTATVASAVIATPASVVRVSRTPLLHGMATTESDVPANAPFLPPQMSRKKAITLGVVIGAAVGATAGYFIAHDSCDSCDDNGPVVLVSSVGAVAGGLLGGFVAAQNSPADPSQSALRSSVSRRTSERVARPLVGYHVASFR